MLISKRQAKRALREIAKAGDDLCHYNNKLFELAEQDDWSFVIKAHAMLEAAVTEALLAHLGEPRIKRVVERLPLSDNQIGKVVIAKQLELLDDKDRRFIRFFSELRNNLVHRFENLSFKFEHHLSTLDKNQKQSWKDAIVFSEEANARQAWERMVERQTKMAILNSLLYVMAKCSLNSHYHQAMGEMEEASKKTTARVLKDLGLLRKASRRNPKSSR